MMEKWLMDTFDEVRLESALLLYLNKLHTACVDITGAIAGPIHRCPKPRMQCPVCNAWDVFVAVAKLSAHEEPTDAD